MANTTVEKIKSPYDGAVVGEMPVAGEREVEAAIVSAQRGFETMRRLPPLRVRVTAK